MRPFGKTSSTLRVVAALTSLTLTAAIFMLLRATSTPPAATRGERQVAVAIFPLPAARPQRKPVPEPIDARAAPREARRAAASSRSSPPLRAEPARATEAEPPTLPSDTAASPRALAEPASAPLRLDARTIGRAIAGSEGAIRQMARNVGADLDSPKASRAEALAGTVADKGVPDCLAPNAAGSLLSVPILLVLAVQGRCK